MNLRRRQLAVPLLIALSLFLHRLLLASIPEAPAASTAVVAKPSLVEFSVGTREIETPTEATVAEPRTPDVPVVPRPRSTPAPVVARDSMPTPAAEASTATEPPAQVLPSAPERDAPVALDLSPRALALSMMAPAEPRADESDLALDLAKERGADLAAGLAAAANARPSRPQRSLDLVRDPDGTCHYEGEAVIATILPDGGVEFVDRPGHVERKEGPDEPPEVPMTPDEMVAPQRLEVAWKYTPRAWAAEREWFLRETSELRSQLSHAARERELARAGAHLERELERIWCDGSRSAERRREAIFALWSEASDDEIGARARQIVVDFVRRNLPANDELAYSRQELARLNAEHAGRGRFDPYAESDAGVRD